MFRFIRLLVLGLAAGAPGIAQETTSPETEPTPAVAEAALEPTLSSADLANRADDIAAMLLDMQQTLETDVPELSDIPGKINALRDDLEERLKTLTPGDIGDISKSEVETLLQTLGRMNRELTTWHDQLQNHADALDADARAVKLQTDFFQSVLNDDDADDLPDALIERVTQVIAKLDAMKDAIRKRLDATLAELTRISAIRLRSNEAAQLLESSRKQRERDALSVESGPIWTAGIVDEPLPQRLAQELRARFDSALEFSRANVGGMVTTFILLIVTLALSLYGRKSIIRRGEESDPDLARRLFVERPIAVSFVLWAIVSPQIFLPPLPLALTVIRGLTVVVALWRMLPLIAPDAERGLAAALLALFALDLVAEILPLGDLTNRLAYLVMCVAGIYLFIRIRATLKESPPGERSLWWQMGMILASLAPFLLGACLIGLLIGAVAFAELTVGAILGLYIVLLAIVVAEDSLNAAAHYFISGWGQRWLRSIRRYPELTRRRFAVLIRLGMLATFLSILPRLSPIVSNFYEWLIAAFTADFSVGTVEMSVADTFFLIFGFVVAIVAAKFIRFTLDEDVFPHLPIATGAAAAASRLIYYALVAGGIMFALAAGGVELNKLTLLVSALGVGIGFGLQGIVNNFVSGLVLAFERPFQVGDIIAVGTLTGRVREIGLRASRVRTFDGAEVIVPNADLIAGNVINWTLSDRMRRLDLKIGVAYGTDPTQVREILQQVAEDNEEVAKNPEPAALFDGFGDSSLNFTLRAWISEAGDWPQFTSDLYVAIYAALNAADIEIPFPQRTLHIQSDDRPE